MKPLLVGIDVGFGQIKAVAADGRSLSIPSWIAPVPEDSIGTKHAVTVTDKGKQYLVGEDAARFARARIPTVDSAWHEEPAFRILFRYVAQHFGTDHMRVATGLPVRYFVRNRDSLKKTMESFSGDGLTVEVVTVVPQPAGTLWSCFFDPSGAARTDFGGRVGIIDIGNGTIDAIEVNDSEMSWTSHASEPRGVSRAYEYLHSVVRSKGLNLRITDMPQLVDNPVVKDAGKEINFKRAVAESKRIVVQSVQDIVDELWGSTSALNHIIFTGGGSAFVRQELEQTFSRTSCTIPKEPHLANAQGYVRIAAEATQPAEA